MPVTPTDEQQSIMQAVAARQSSLMVSAYAGTAKTTTLELAAPAIGVPALALAFNKKIATELSGRMPDNFKVQTLNGLGHGAWVRALNAPAIKLDDRKIGKLVSAVAKDLRIDLLTWQWDAIRTAVTSAMQAGLSPDDIGTPLVPDNEITWYDLIEVPSEDDFPLIYELAHKTLSLSIDLARQGHISFDDQIYCPTILGGRWPHYPQIFADEFQDFSPLNHHMLSLAKTPDGLICGVGDQKQSIYAFRGADHNSMQNGRWTANSWQDLSLTLTFRCPKVVVARQQEHAPGYRAAPANLEGNIVTLEAWSWQDISNYLYKASVETDKPATCAVLCRNNAPLLSLAFKLIRSGVGCQMQGRDIGRGLVQLSKKLAPPDELPIVKFATRLTEWEEHETSLAKANDKPDRAERIADQAACLRATIDGASPQTAGDLRAVLERLFSRESSSVILSSIHRAKGLEWPLVIHLDPWRIPSKQSRQAALTGDPAPLQQEHNLLYVAETRTKHTLINANLESFT